MPATAEPPPAPSTAAPAAPPSPPTEKAPQDYLGDITSELADMDAGTPPPPPPEKPRDEKGKFRPVPPKPEGGKPAAEIKPPEGEVKPPEGETKPSEGETPKPVRAAELRTAYEGLKKKVAEDLQPTIQRLEAKIKEYESKTPEEAPAPILEKIKKLEDRNKQLEQLTELHDFEQSETYQTKYAQPYSDKWSEAVDDFSQLRVREPAGTDEETGEAKFTYRNASEADLIKLGSMPVSEMDEAATAMFGASAPRAIQHINELRKLARAKQNAVAEAAKKAGEWRSSRELQSKAAQKAMNDAWGELNKAMAEKWPNAYKPEEGNTEDAAAHSRGFALADLVFLGQEGLTTEQIEALPAAFKDVVKARNPLTPEQRLRLHAIARLKIANHDRQVARAKKLAARVAELEKTLAEYEQSEPRTTTAGHSPRTAPKAWDEQVADELKAMDK